MANVLLSWKLKVTIVELLEFFSFLHFFNISCVYLLMSGRPLENVIIHELENDSVRNAISTLPVIITVADKLLSFFKNNVIISKHLKL